jgi:hypothetical protein
LDLIPPTGLIRDEFWKTKEDAEAVLMGAYQSFASMNTNLFKYGELRGDMVKYARNVGNNERNIIESNIYPENGLCSWGDFYKVINYTNEVIKNAPVVQGIDKTFTDYQLKSMLAEAYFVRGLAYFYLVRIFKDVPYITEPSETDDAEFYIKKTDGDEILHKVIEELKANRTFVTKDGYPTLKELKGRATQAAYDALIADIALWLFDYQTCIDYVDKVLSNELYVLMPSSKFFEIYYPGNSLEGIFEFQFDQSKSQNNGTFDITNRNAYQYIPSQKALEMFARDYDARELYRGEDAAIMKYADEDYIIWKYVGKAGGIGSVRSSSEQKSCNWIVYRVADVMLMKAEALSQLGRFDEASEILNEIRTRADVSALSLPNSKIDYEDAILDERALELAYEGKRWFDLLRMGRRNNFARKSELIEIIIKNAPSTQKRILATKLANPLGWYLPISASEIERNPALIQNPFYVN